MDLIERIKEKIILSVNQFNESSVWRIQVFDINIFDIDYHIDKPVKTKIKELSQSQNFISACFSTDSIEKRNSIKELSTILENELGIKIVHVKNLTTKHFYVYFEYKNSFIFDSKARKKLISKSV